ncbi:hypothetical protein Mgra_00003704 [Meloidogyne graminicola]|uniref:Uncharacterized protein n=1 Tax=Meloidogyne graminicola TaxID=189291 RepID=A0A8S9ZT83_9BILA|nr:hypothetical protein Mgra_00003704 [Meloidogyne graminicola]
MGIITSSLCFKKFKRGYYIQNEINKIFNSEYEQKNKRIIKILLLGPSDSGKSTILRQMRILHNNGFSIGEKSHYRYTIYSNCLDIINHIALGIYKLNINIPPNERELINKFANLNNYQLLKWNELEEGKEDEIGNNNNNIIKSMAKFFEFVSVKQACKRIMEFTVPDNTFYILEEKERILKLDYIPIQEDIVNARCSTLGIYEINFDFRNFVIRLIDVGGQRTERRKWIHCFDNIEAILFIVSLACYNNILADDNSINQMFDAIQLFKNIYTNNYLKKSFFVMFFNKKDIFRKKIQIDPLEKYFPTFTGNL